MTTEEISALCAANAALCEANAALQAQVATLLAANAALQERVATLERQLALHSGTSSKPPSSDGLARPPRSQRGHSGKAPGGQPGHVGATLALSATPDATVGVEPDVCAACGASLATGACVDQERRQVIDVPPVRPVVTEYVGHTRRCPGCGTTNRPAFPAGVAAPVQYGARVRAVAVYLQTQQLLPQGRTREVLADLLGCALSRRTVAACAAEAAATLEPVEATIADALRAAPVLHNDETGLRVAGRTWWLHSASTATLTHYSAQPRRGRAGMDAAGILPGFAGTSVHDGWAPYQAYPCRHALCNAHHLRELAAVLLHDGQAWAGEMATLLRRVHRRVQQALAAGERALSPATRRWYRGRYRALLAQGREANPPLPFEGRRGRQRQTPAKNLLDRLAREDEVLACLADLRVPWDNNQAERDVRMVKVQQKVSGGYRSAAGARVFARVRGYLSTLRKQGLPVLAALEGVAAGRPLLPTL